MDAERAVYHGLAVEGYPFDWSHLWLERYRTITSLTIQTTGSAFGAILVLTFLFLHPREAVIVASLVGKCMAGLAMVETDRLLIALVNAELIGWMSLVWFSF
jgi:hypothetical protein